MVVVVVGGAVVGGAVVGRRRWSAAPLWAAPLSAARSSAARGGRRLRRGGRSTSWWCWSTWWCWCSTWSWSVGGLSSSPSESANAAITPTSTIASTINAAMSQRCAGDMPPSSSSWSGGRSSPPPPAPAAPARRARRTGARRGHRDRRFRQPAAEGLRRCRCPRSRPSSPRRPWAPPRHRSCRTPWHPVPAADRTHRSSGTRSAPSQAPSVRRAATAWSCTRAASSRAMPSTRSACEAP